MLILVVVPNYVTKLYDDFGDEFLKSLIWLSVSLLFSAFVLLIINPQAVTFYGRYCAILGNPNGLGIFTMLNFFLYSTVVDLSGDKPLVLKEGVIPIEKLKLYFLIKCSITNI